MNLSVNPMQTIASRRGLLRGAAITAGAAGAALVLDPQAAQAATTTYTGAASVGQCSIVNGADVSGSAKMGLVILLPHEYWKIPGIKAANPKTKVFCYKNLGAVSKNAYGANQPSVVTYQQVQNNPGWALHDNRGATIYWTDFGGYLQPIDMGDPAVINASVQGLVAECKQNKWDGIYLDDVNSEWGHSNTGSSAPVDFTGGSAMASTTAWIQQAAPQLKAAGLEVVGNAQMTYQTWQSVLGAWSGYLSGINLEHFTRWGDYSSSQWPNFTGGNWDMRRQQAALMQSKGSYLMGLTFGDSWDTVGMHFHRATFLMLTDGGGYSLWTPSNFSGSFNQPEAMLDLGAPTGAAQQMSNGLWKRTFEKGFVVVNPTGATQGGTAASANLGFSTEWVNINSGDALLRTW